jgi:hypothetical protein
VFDGLLESDTMKALPLKLRISIAGGALGIALGGLVPHASSARPAMVVMCAVAGGAAGFLLSGWIGSMLGTQSALRRSERVVLGAEKAAVVFAWLLTIAGLIGLIASGWSLSLMFSTMFFLVAAVYLTSRM